MPWSFMESKQINMKTERFARALSHSWWIGVFLLSVRFLHAQDPNTKTYRVHYQIVNKQKHLDISGKVVKQTDTLYLESDKGEINSFIRALASTPKGLLSNVRFGEEEDKLFVNPFLVYDDQSGSFIDREQMYYYRLENRQSIKIKFNHFSFKAITVPLKVRFGQNDVEFSTDANLGVFGGYSWGISKFTRKEGIGNKETEHKNTLGILLGTEQLEFDFVDENRQTIEEKSALISTGVGFVHSYQNFTAGLTGGFDFALGENKNNWNYHARPWLGLAIGYSIFSF